MFDAQWILDNHKKYASRAEVLRIQLRRLSQVSGDEAIENWMLSRPPVDGMPHGKRGESPTEAVALELDERTQRERLATQRLRERLKRELADCLYYLDLYNAAMSQLTEDERRFVAAHFDREMTLGRMAQADLFQDSQFRSLTTLGRIKKRILQKVQDAMGPAGQGDSRGA